MQKGGLDIGIFEMRVALAAFLIGKPYQENINCVILYAMYEDRKEYGGKTMRINFNSVQPKNTIINAARVNASFAKNNSRTGKSAGTGRSDRADFSPQGKLMSMIENLTKQKQTIIDRKNELMENTLKNGGKVDDIQGPA